MGLRFRSKSLRHRLDILDCGLDSEVSTVEGVPVEGTKKSVTPETEEEEKPEKDEEFKEMYP